MERVRQIDREDEAALLCLDTDIAPVAIVATPVVHEHEGAVANDIHLDGRAGDGQAGDDGGLLKIRDVDDLQAAIAVEVENLLVGEDAVDVALLDRPGGPAASVIRRCAGAGIEGPIATVGCLVAGRALRGDEAGRVPHEVCAGAEGVFVIDDGRICGVGAAARSECEEEREQ